MKTKEKLLWVAGGLLFVTVVGGQYQHNQKQDRELRKYFSLLLNEKKGLENHLHYLEQKEEILLKRMKRAEAELDSFQKLK